MPRHLALPFALLALLALAPTAQGAIRAKPSLVTAGGKTQIVVELTSKSKLRSRTKPLAVSVVARKKTYKLKRQRGGSANGGTWKSRPFGGSAARRLTALAGKRIRVRVKTRAKTLSIGAKLVPVRAGGDEGGQNGGGGAVDNGGGAVDNGGGTGDGGSGGGSANPQPLFEAPGRELSGEETRPFLNRYFVDSRFTDCPAGWPSCAVETRYTHCGSGEHIYERLTPSSGSDTRAVGAYSVTGAVVHADGSWGVEYTVSAYSNLTYYSWQVARDGTATGVYTGPSGAQEQLGPLLWVKPGGSC